jgi:hypothetical protein
MKSPHVEPFEKKLRAGSTQVPRSFGEVIAMWSMSMVSGPNRFRRRSNAWVRFALPVRPVATSRSNSPNCRAKPKPTQAALSARTDLEEWNPPEDLTRVEALLITLLGYHSASGQLASLDRVGKALGFSEIVGVAEPFANQEERPFQSFPVIT